MNKKAILIGNPNSGKSSLFNLLTGLHQKVANFSGVTVDKKEGFFKLNNNCLFEIVDLPGIYSLYPKKEDEEVSYKFIFENINKLDLIIVTVDATNLKRNLLFCSQIIDLKIPVVIALTMNDIAKKKKIRINKNELERFIGVPIVEINPRKNINLNELKKVLEKIIDTNINKTFNGFISFSTNLNLTINSILKINNNISEYEALHYAIYPELQTIYKDKILEVIDKYKFNKTIAQGEDIQNRYKKIDDILKKSVLVEDPLKKELQTHKLDNILLHKRWGYIIMFCVLFLIFQSIFWLAKFPMEGIEYLFANFSSLLEKNLPSNIISNLIVNGIIAGLSGILVFIPQISILTGLITLLEDSGYMSRISFLTDKAMRSVGLNGKSLIPLISGLACAVPAIMNARTIENKKEKLLTIFILPLITCSARLPVFTILIAIIVPNKFLFGILSLQGIVLMCLYLLSFLLSFLISFTLKFIIKTKEKSFFILELPYYKYPNYKNLIFNVFEKTKIFVLNAGKIIMIIAIILWSLANFGFNTKEIKKEFEVKKTQNPTMIEKFNQEEETALLENSFAGKLGKFIEPFIEPLGFDWRIGISLITSFAAREVFVGTMATLYNLEKGNDDEINTLQKKLAIAKKADGTLLFTTASTCSLILFYLISLQCMSTFAIVKRETKSWKFAFIQLIFYTFFAYFISWLVYNCLK